MGTVEENLRRIIIEKYGSVKEFSLKIGIPYTTIASILKRGVERANARNLNKIAGTLNIDMLALLNGRVEPLKFRDVAEDLTPREREDVSRYIEFIKSKRKDEPESPD